MILCSFILQPEQNSQVKEMSSDFWLYEYTFYAATPLCVTGSHSSNNQLLIHKIDSSDI